ncbi:hypothetical protein [Bacillus sp. FJAT-28004]|uniref:hypothetical protein n=1 Tax=Bacillus sp. FJAT-28004 TaxID=1679165 RepID=UPI0006B635A0|nr:hypothetical protein [Bacillus sp. FJAT-28004]
MKKNGTTVDYFLHIDHNYHFYIQFVKGEACYGLWSEIEKMNIPMYILEDGNFKWGMAPFDIPKFVEKNALGRMKKLYNFHLKDLKESDVISPA